MQLQSNERRSKTLCYAIIKRKYVYCLPWITEKDYFRLHRKEWARNHPEYSREKARRGYKKYYQKNYQKIVERNREWAKNNPEKYKERRRLTRKKYYKKIRETRIMILNKRYILRTASEQMKPIINGLITVRKIKRIIKGNEAPAESNIINKTGVSQ